MVNECIDCPKETYLKKICPYQDYPDNHAKLKYKDIDCNCAERMRLIRENDH